MKKTLEYIDIDNLIPYINNAREHSPAQVAQIAASIKEFGFTNPVLIDSDNGIIAGHGRILAARMLGIKEIPTLKLADLTDTQRKAYILADNKLALNAGWNEELLTLELNELEEMGFDLELTGFSLDEIEVIVDGATIPLDEVEEIKEECVIQIICKDWNEREMAIARLGGKKIDWLDVEGMLR